MARLLQLSMLIAALVVARHFLYRWLGARDSLRIILHDALDVLVGYFMYVTAGMLIFSWLSGASFVTGNGLATALLTVAGGLYVGGGVLLVWLLLARKERGQRKRL
jgi:hypothetical protein